MELIFQITTFDFVEFSTTLDYKLIGKLKTVYNSYNLKRCNLHV